MKLFIVVLILALPIVFNQNATACISSLECKSTGCCKKGECVDTSTCKSSVRTVYIAVSLVGFVFIVITIIYYITSIKETRENVRIIRQKMMDKSIR